MQKRLFTLFALIVSLSAYGELTTKIIDLNEVEELGPYLLLKFNEMYNAGRLHTDPMAEASAQLKELKKGLLLGTSNVIRVVSEDGSTVGVGEITLNDMEITTWLTPIKSASRTGPADALFDAMEEKAKETSLSIKISMLKDGTSGKSFLEERGYVSEGEDVQDALRVVYHKQLQR